jgi:hypothetical protein
VEIVPLQYTCNCSQTCYTLVSHQDYHRLTLCNTAEIITNIIIAVNYLHDHIISLRGEIWAHNTSLTPPLFIEVFLPSQESEWSCICVLGVSILPLPTILIFDFRIVLTVWYFRIVLTV